MGRAGRNRKFHGTDAEIALARFLTEISESAGLSTVAKLAERLPEVGRSSTWADYLNGTKLIPKKHLGALLEELRRQRPESWNNRLITRANRLWDDAKYGATPSDASSTALTNLRQRFLESQNALVMAETVATGSEGVIRLLLQFSGQQETRIAALTREVGHLQDKERASAAHQLDQARFRLSRIHTELERARSDRYTAEQAQSVLLREQRETLREIEALRQVTNVPDWLDDGTWDSTPLPAPVAGPELSDEEIDREMDERLDLIRTGGDTREALLSEVLRQADMDNETAERGPSDLPGTFISEDFQRPDPASPTSPGATSGLSTTIPDNTNTSKNAVAQRLKFRRAAGFSAAVVLASLLVWGTYSAFSEFGGASPGPSGSGDSTVRIGILEKPKSDTHTYSGYDARVSSMAAKALGMEPLYQQVTTANRASMLQRNYIDLMMLPITEDRMSELDFAGPYVRTPSALLVRADSKPLSKESDLDGKTVCTVRGSTFAAALEETSGVDLEQRASINECTNQLLNPTSKVEAVLSDALTLYGLAREYRAVTVTGQSLVPGYENYGIAMPKGQRKECDRLKRKIKKYIESIQWTKDINELPQVFREDNWTDYLPDNKQIEKFSCRDEPGP
ncbi:transporter substrate-binding domain-containing protein [Streptomyces anulatus]|uniref:transporter substrate-binding domain-containing protein n=1 Tax=Streptomyces anulatus TaxID=1892 RepID=UPI002F909CB0|nr:transporter substrate-binding domain-containing protein [Streptomyces anulatus]